jgi:ankyrin repeat protein
VVDLLLKNGADIKAGNFFGTALHAAAENGHAEVVRLLLEKRADIYWYNSNSRRFPQILPIPDFGRR